MAETLEEGDYVVAPCNAASRLAISEKGERLVEGVSLFSCDIPAPETAEKRIPRHPSIPEHARF